MVMGSLSRGTSHTLIAVKAKCYHDQAVNPPPSLQGSYLVIMILNRIEIVCRKVKVLDHDVSSDIVSYEKRKVKSPKKSNFGNSRERGGGELIREAALPTKSNDKNKYDIA